MPGSLDDLGHSLVLDSWGVLVAVTTSSLVGRVTALARQRCRSIRVLTGLRAVEQDKVLLRRVALVLGWVRQTGSWLKPF